MLDAPSDTSGLNRRLNNLSNTEQAAEQAVQRVGNLNAIELGNEPNCRPRTSTRNPLLRHDQSTLRATQSLAGRGAPQKMPRVRSLGRRLSEQIYREHRLSLRASSSARALSTSKNSPLQKEGRTHTSKTTARITTPNPARLPTWPPS